MQPDGSLQHSQQPAICPYPEPDKYSPRLPIQLLKIHFNITLPSTLVFQVFFSPHFPPPKFCMQIFCSPYVPHAPPVVLFLVGSSETHLVSSTDR